MRMRWLAAVAAMGLGVGSAWAGDITVVDPFARASSAVAQAGAAFMTIRNGGAADRLVKAETPASERTELHTVTRDGDVMRMRMLEWIDVPAGGEATLRPGGLHVMLLGLRQPLKEGATVPLTLVFEKAGAITVEVPVKGAGAGMPPAAMPGMSHDSMPHGAHPATGQ